MSLDVYFREDVARVLDSVDIASGRTAGTALCELYDAEITTPSNAQVMRDTSLYRRGFRDALIAVALAFGVDPNHYTVDPNANPAELPRAEHYHVFHWER